MAPLPKTEETETVAASSTTAAEGETEKIQPPSVTPVEGNDTPQEDTSPDSSGDPPEETKEQKIERATKLFEEGKKSFVTNLYAEASKSLADACSLYSELYGEVHPECADLYMYYGRALLELARMEPGVFSNALTGVAEEESGEDEVEEGEGTEAEEKPEGEEKETKEKEKEPEKEELFENADTLTEEEREEIHENVEDALEENAEALAEGKVPSFEEAAKEEEEVPEEPTSTPAEDKEEEKEAKEGEEAVVEAGEGEAMEGEEVAEEETEEDVPNLQLAYEMLDLARVISEKQEGAKWQEKLSECRLRLGEVAIDDERYEDAVTELGECISLQKTLFSANDRRIAETYFQLGRAKNLGNNFTEAADSYKTALEIINAKLEEVKGGVESAKEDAKKKLEGEVTELESLIPEIKAKISDCEESAKTATEMKESGETKEEESNGFKPTTDSDKPVDTITHLVRKPLKRKPEEEGTEGEEGTKKAREENGAGDSPSMTNGHAKEPEVTA